MSKNDRLAKRLTQAEERHAKAEAAADASFANHVTAVGALVPSGAGSTMVSLAFEGSPVEAVEIVKDALKRPDHQADASEILTALLLAGDGFWQDGAIVAGRLVNSDSALLLDPAEQTVTLYRPRESSDKPIGKWTFAEWLEVVAPSWGPDAGTREEREAAYFRAEAYVNLMDPTYSAVWGEARAAETEMFAARKALEEAMRPRLALVTT